MTSQKECSECGVNIFGKTLDYSVKKYGKPLCYECQHKRKDTDEEIKPEKLNKYVPVSKPSNENFKPNYEDNKQTLIVRQVALKCACEIYSKDPETQVSIILKCAEEFEKWILR